MNLFVNWNKSIKLTRVSLWVDFILFLFVIAWPFCHILGGNMQFFAVSARIQWLNPCAIDYFQKLIISHKYVTFELLLNIQRYIRWWKQYKCYFWGLISGGNIKNNQVSARKKGSGDRFLILIFLVNIQYSGRVQIHQVSMCGTLFSTS